MSEQSKQPIHFEPTETQLLRLQLAQLACELNFARRGHMDAEQRFYQLSHNVAEAALKPIEAELARIEQEESESVRKLFDIVEQIKAENDWPHAVTWDPVTLKFSASVEATTQCVKSDDHVLRIQ